LNEPKTITFKCPWCKNTCAFKDVNAGKSARCTSCQNHFVIPASDGVKAKKIKPEPLESDGDVISGFYPAVLKKSWPIIFSKSNTAGLVFVVVLIVAKFIVWRFNFNFSFPVEATGKTIVIPIFIGKTIGTSAYALIFWYYMEIIYATAFGIDNFPEANLGLLVAIVCKIVKTLYLVFVSMIVAQLPTLTAMLILHVTGTDAPVVLVALAAIGCLIFPMLILMAAISQDLVSVLRIDLAIRAILKVLPKYCLAALITVAVGIAAVLSKNFQPKLVLDAPLLNPLFLIANILTAIAGTYAARALGLLYKHHGGQMPW